MTIRITKAGAQRLAKISKDGHSYDHYNSPTMVALWKSGYVERDSFGSSGGLVRWILTDKGRKWQS